MATFYEIIAAQLLRINPRNHEAWNDWGVAICEKAMPLPNEEAVPMFAEAARKFATACDLQPRNADCWSNLGNAKYQQGLRSPDDVALLCFREAGEAYERVIRLSPRRHDSWMMAGDCLWQQAQRTEKERCEPLYHAACVRFTVLTDLQPRDVEAWRCLGSALLSHSGRTEVSNKSRLAMQSATVFEQAVRLAPDRHEIINLYAYALSEVVRYLPDAPNADAWLADAHTRLTEAISLSPDTAVYWENRAKVLAMQARRLPRSEQENRLADADAQYTVAQRLNPQDETFFLDWGRVCAERAHLAENAADAVERSKEASAKYRDLTRFMPGFTSLWLEWANVCQYLAWDDVPENRYRWMCEANEKFARANELTADNPHCLALWACNLMYLERYGAEADAENFLAQAEEKARQGSALAPDWTYALTMMGFAFIRHATRETDPDKRAALFAEAIANADEADAKQRGSAAYNRACIAALTGDEAGCEKHLREYVAANPTLNRRRVRADEDLASARNAPWFRELFGAD